jgi:hypothetical protein
MNKAELIAQIESNGYTVLPGRETGTEGDIKHLAVPGIRVVDGVGKRKWFKFYERITDGECFWMDADPFYTPTPVESYQKKLEQFLQNKIDAGVILAGFVEVINPVQETAIVLVVVQDGESYVQKRYLISKNESGNPKITPIG